MVGFRISDFFQFMELKIKNISSEWKKIPKSPGVYFFKKGNQILYVGKAGSLRDRIRSYFSSDSLKINRLISESDKISFIKTDSVLEALFKEANLIKKYQPIFNVREKDNRSFVYLVIPKFKIKDFPYPIVIRKRELLKYPSSDFYIFGPFKSWSILKKALYLLRRIFPYCEKPNSKRPCFYYQIGLCAGACIGKISKQEYQKIIKNLILFLEGKKKKLLKNLKKDFPEKIEILKNIQDSILLSKEGIGEDFPIRNLRIEGYDISHFSGKGSYGSMVVFENNLPNKEEYRIFKIKKAKEKDDLSCLREVIERRIKHTEWSWPDLILVDGGINQVNAVYEVVKDKKIPVVGIAKGRSRKNNRLIFKGVRRNLRNIISISKPVLIRVRDEAHRFAIKFSRKYNTSKIK